MSKKIEMIDRKFGRFTVIKEVEKINGRIRYKCRCKCGDIKNVSGEDLRSGNTKSCGCHNRDVHTTHNMSNTREYTTWEGMKRRCNNPNHKKYSDYGGRGIKVCVEWLNSFETFYKDMGVRPLGLELDRKNNELGYYKENCRWATRTQQMRNVRLSKHNKTGVAGVYWGKRLQKYIAGITINNKHHHIGCFVTLNQAAQARKQAEINYW